MDLFKLANVFWRSRVLFATALVSGLACCLFIMRIAPRTYRAQAVLMFDSSRSLRSKQGDELAIGVLEARRLRSEALLAKSETVVTLAIANAQHARGVGISGAVTDGEIRKAQRSIKVEVEPDTDLLVISFKSGDANDSALMANGIASALIEAETRMRSNPLAATFFNEKVALYKIRLASDTRALETFSLRHRLYSIVEQRKLTLARHEKIQESLNETDEAVKGVSAQISSLRTQLSSLKSKMYLPPAIFGDTTADFGAARRATPDAGFGADPPLLHVRLYQDSAQKLVNLNAEMAGKIATEKAQRQELDGVSGELETMAAREGEFDALQAQVARDKENISLYSQKAADADVYNASASKEGFSNLQLVERAAVPDMPSFPTLIVVGPICLAGALSISTFFVLAIEGLRALRRNLASQDPPQFGATRLTQREPV